jgi:ribonuclease HI
MSGRTFRIEFDGGARGNPGPAGFGVVVRDAADGQELLTYGKFIGNATNNVAEYSGLIAGLTKALELSATSADVYGDSELVIKQMKGEYRVKNEGLRPLYEKATQLSRKFAGVKFTHVRREQNKLADKLYNRAIDKKGEVFDVDGGE